MLDKLYFQSGHLTAAALFSLECGGLSEAERLLILTHLEQCPDCMERYLESLEGATLLEPPRGLEEAIAGAVRDEYQARKQKKVKLIQVAKLAVAVCLTMVLSLSGIFPLLGKGDKQTQPLSPNMPYPVPIQKEYKPHSRPLTEMSGNINSSMNQFAAIFRNGFNFGGDGNNDADK